MYLEHLQLKSQPFAEHAAVAALWQDQLYGDDYFSGLTTIRFPVEAIR